MKIYLRKLRDYQAIETVKCSIFLSINLFGISAPGGMGGWSGMWSLGPPELRRLVLGVKSRGRKEESREDTLDPF